VSLRKAGSEAFDGTVHVIPHTHAYVAWVRARARHIDRHVRVPNGILGMLGGGPEHRYHALRSEKLGTLRQHVTWRAAT
jgi:hypothetical protein